MTFCYFATFHGAPEARIGDDEIARLVDIAKATPGLDTALIHTPELTSDPYLNDGPSPPLALQFYFPTIEALEAALATNGPLRALAAPDLLPSLAGTTVDQQAMLTRIFPVPEPEFRTAPGGLPCTYLVHYAAHPH